MVNLISFLMLFLISPLLFAQTYQYEISGSFKLESSKQEPVKYTLRWNEEEGEIQGTYSDNTFGRFAEVTGQGTSLGRTFIVRFAQVKNGVRSINILSSVVKEKTGTTIPVSIVTRDLRGNPLTTTETKTQFVVLNKKETDAKIAQRQEDPECIQGFGFLAGYCGVYGGLIAEEEDRRNRCNLLVADAVRLELTREGTVLLHLGPVSQLVQIPSHAIGRIPYNPQETSLDMLGRVCGPLAGVNSSSTTCKRIHLAGDFSLEDGTRQFEGTYTITEEESNLLCRYDLSLNKQI